MFIPSEDTVFSEAFTPDAMKLRSKTNSNTSKAESRKNKENKEANSLEVGLFLALQKFVLKTVEIYSF